MNTSTRTIGHVWDTAYERRVDVGIDCDSDPEGPALLELQLVDDLDAIVTRLDRDNAIKLRRLLQKFERETAR